MRLAWACLILTVATLPLRADESSKPGEASELVSASGKQAKKKLEPAPLALALDLAFGATIWAEIRISTAGPVADMTKLVREGYYKLELIELILMSAQGRRPLKETLKKRREGAKLSEIAASYRLDYDKLYESALAIEEVVDREYLPRFPDRRPRREKEEP